MYGPILLLTIPVILSQGAVGRSVPIHHSLAQLSCYCMAPHCSDFVIPEYVPGECQCPMCPKGPSCRVGDKLLRVGQTTDWERHEYPNVVCHERHVCWSHGFRATKETRCQLKPIYHREKENEFARLFDENPR